MPSFQTSKYRDIFNGYTVFKATQITLDCVGNLTNTLYSTS